MGSYTVTASAEEDAALAYVAGQANPPETPAVYFDARMHEVLKGYVVQYNVDSAPVPASDVAAAYVMATPEQQDQVVTILSTPPASLQTPTTAG